MSDSDTITVYILRGNKKANHPVSLWGNHATGGDLGPLCFGADDIARQFLRDLKSNGKGMGYTVAAATMQEVRDIAAANGWEWIWTGQRNAIGGYRFVGINAREAQQ